MSTQGNLYPFSSPQGPTFTRERPALATSSLCKELPFCFSSGKLILFGFPEPARPVLSGVDVDRKQVSGAIPGQACVGADGPRSATRVTPARPASPCTLETAPPVSWLQNKSPFSGFRCWLVAMATILRLLPYPPDSPQLRGWRRRFVRGGRLYFPPLRWTRKESPPGIHCGSRKFLF